MIETTIKLEQEFNSMPGIDTILKMLDDRGIKEAARICDYPKIKFWENSLDTLVMSFSANCRMGTGVGLAHFVDDCGSDEFDAVYDGATDSYIVRFWWD